MRFSFATILLVACATTATTSTPKGGPRGLRASDHLDLARQHDAEGRSRSVWPRIQQINPGSPELVGMPWYRSWDTVTEHERIGAIHRSKAAELQLAYEHSCADQPAEEVSVSPLVRFGIGGWPTASGVIIYLSPDAGTPDHLLATMKCHRAFMMLGSAGMDNCPLDLPGMVLDARGDADGVTVSLTVKDTTLVPELQRRTVLDLEAAQHRGSTMSLHKEN